MATTPNASDAQSAPTGSGYSDLVKSIFGDAVDVYKASRQPATIGSNGQTAPVQPNQPVPAPVTPANQAANALPAWALFMLGGSVMLLVAALAIKALK